MHMLCICARKTGSISYGTVVGSSCGRRRAHWQTSALEIGALMLLMTHHLTMNVTARGRILASKYESLRNLSQFASFVHGNHHDTFHGS